MVKKIIYGGLFTLPDGDAAAQRVNGIGNVLEELGYRVIYVGISDDPNCIININEQVGYNKYIASAKPKSFKQWVSAQISAKLLEKAILDNDNVEAVILYNFPSIAFETIKALCKHKKIKLYVDCTEWHHAGKDSHLAVIKNLDTFKRMHFDNNRTDGLIVISSFLKQYYRNKKTIQVPPIYDYQLIRRVQRDRQDDFCRFVFTGTVSSQKETVQSIVEAALQLSKKYSQFTLDIFGVSMEDYQKSVSTQDDIDRNGQIRFYGRVSHERCIEEIQNADFQIFIREVNRVNTAGFSTKFAESFACGTPVITTRTSDVADYLIDDVTGYFVVDNVENVMEKAILSTKEQRELIRENVCKERAFDYRTYIDRMRDFLK